MSTQGVNFKRWLFGGLISIAIDSGENEAKYVGLMAAFAGAAAGVAFGLPLAAVAVSAGAAGIGAGAASKLSELFLNAAYDGRGPEAGVFGLMLQGLAKVTAVPVAAVAAARYALKATGFVP